MNLIFFWFTGLEQGTVLSDIDLMPAHPTRTASGFATPPKLRVR
jgi:hypothetical protein